MTKKPSNKTIEHFEGFIAYLASPWRLVWINFIAGVFRGLGTVVGAGLVLGILFWILGIFADFPLIGEYVKDFKNTINSYIEETNYKEELSDIKQILKNIETKIAQPK